MIRQFTSKTQQFGLQGEDMAVVFLMKHKFSIIERNSNSRNGEIDIVAKKKRKYYFFEVKTGKEESWFNPADNLTKEKLSKLFRSVEYYCYTRNIKYYSVQGIVVLLRQYDSSVASIEIIDLT
jgi:putative endonuclease